MEDSQERITTIEVLIPQSWDLEAYHEIEVSVWIGEDGKPRAEAI